VLLLCKAPPQIFFFQPQFKFTPLTPYPLPPPFLFFIIFSLKKKEEEGKEEREEGRKEDYHQILEGAVKINLLLK
jgi:hypothetical protein